MTTPEWGATVQGLAWWVEWGGGGGGVYWLMLAPQSQCVAKLTLQSVFYWQTVKITDSVYSIPVTASVWAGVQSLHLLL